MVSKCSICEKPIEKKEEVAWNWADEPAHKLCVLNKAEVACDNMTCFDLLDEEQDECECGDTLKPITNRERKALFV